MGQQNTDTLEHLLDEFVNSFRDGELAQVINDLDEEGTGRGFSEISRTGPFTNNITVWDSAAKNKKRTETDFIRSGAFITDVVKVTYDEDTGTVIMSTLTATITRTGNNFVNTVDVQVTR